MPASAPAHSSDSSRALKLVASVAGRFVPEGKGEVRTIFHRSYYVAFSDGRYACIADPSVGRGPLNALVDDFRLPVVSAPVALTVASRWTPPPPPPNAVIDIGALEYAARNRVPSEGFGCLIVGAHNSLSGHAQPALDAIERWLIGNALDDDVQMLVGLGPGLTPSGDDYLGGILIALQALERRPQAQALWRWLEPRLTRTSAISAAHLAAAAGGEGHEALHGCLEALASRSADWMRTLDAVANVGHVSGWDALAGIAAVAKLS